MIHAENKEFPPFTAEEEAALIDFFLAQLTEQQLAKLNNQKKDNTTNKEQP